MSSGGVGGNGVDENGSEFGIQSMLSPDVPHDKWIPVNVPGLKPSARYKHAAEVFGEKMYVVGGSRNGRYLSDIQVLDLRSSAWSELKLRRDSDGVEPTDVGSEEALLAISGHSLVKWEDKLFVVAGNSKLFSDTVSVWAIDPIKETYVYVKTHGGAPIARGGQSVTLIGSKLVIFGGEDKRRRILNDLAILDLKTMSWDVVGSRKNDPSPRFDHSAAVYADRYLLIFGGCSHSTFFSDLHILDLHTMEWSETQVQGDIVNPRAGHAGAIFGGSWYIVGGGDNKNGALETIKLNMSKLVWSVATEVPERDPLASEGLCLCSAVIDGETLLVAFGGYNGKYHNELFVLKPKPSASAAPRILQSSAAAAAAASVTAAYALATTESKTVDSSQTKINTKEIEAETSSQTEINAILVEKKMLQSQISDVRDENVKLKDNLEELKGSHRDLSMELESIQGQLEAERSRCFKLELQVADINKKLENQHSIERELELLRNSLQYDHTEANRQSSGVWQWMTGGSLDSEK